MDRATQESIIKSQLSLPKWVKFIYGEKDMPLDEVVLIIFHATRSEHSVANAKAVLNYLEDFYTGTISICIVDIDNASKSFQQEYLGKLPEGYAELAWVQYGKIIKRFTRSDDNSDVEMFFDRWLDRKADIEVALKERKRLEDELELYDYEQDWGICNADPERAREFRAIAMKTPYRMVREILFELVLASYDDLLGNPETYKNSEHTLESDYQDLKEFLLTCQTENFTTMYDIDLQYWSEKFEDPPEGEIEEWPIAPLIRRFIKETGYEYKRVY